MPELSAKSNFVHPKMSNKRDLVCVLVICNPKPHIERYNPGSDLGTWQTSQEMWRLVLRMRTNPAAKRTSLFPVPTHFFCQYGGIPEILSRAYDMCAFPGPPIALRAGGHGPSFLAFSRPFTNLASNTVLTLDHTHI